MESLSTRPKRDHDRRTYYTLYTPIPDADAAAHVAEQLGARFEGPVGELDQYFWISVPKTSISKRNLEDDEDGLQRLFQRLRRSSALQKRSSNEAIDRVTRLDRQTPRRKLYKRSVIPTRQLEEPPVIENIEAEQDSNHEVISSLTFLNQPGGFDALRNTLGIHDPGFDQQWHLINQEQLGHDINVTGVWSQGVTGENVVVAILDDGLDMDSEDLKDNFFAAGSYDFNARTALPKPRLEDDRHGTRCAGEIAAARNSVCGVGVAYGAKVAGIRILSEDITDADEAEALNYAYQQNHIYSCSWGPPDLGEVVEAPQNIVLDAIKNGIAKGRNGSGTIYVFASGNGGSNDDNCNYDGYTNSMYTITVGAIDRMENHPYYSERCSAQLVVTYSSGSGGHIYTTDVGQNECYDRHGGTSAAAPLAAGIFALVLSVRPDLTWRDMQYLCVETAIPISLEDPDWATLPSGRMYNHKFGYGKLDAYAIVERAKTFESVRPQTYLEIPLQLDEPQLIPDLTELNAAVDKSRALTSTISVSEEWVAKAGLGRLEHVTATVNIEHSRRGDLETLLESPNDVVSQLGAPRKFDTSPSGLRNWTFMTVKHWGENPVGNWTLRVIDGKNPQYTGTFVNWTLTLWGELAEGFEGEPIHSPLSANRPIPPDPTAEDITEEADYELDIGDVAPPMETEISTSAVEQDTTFTTTYMHVPTLIDPFDEHDILLKDDPPVEDYRSFFSYTLVALIFVAGAIATVFLVRRRVLGGGYSSVQQQEPDRYEVEEIGQGRDNSEPKVKRQSISNSKGRTS